MGCASGKSKQGGHKNTDIFNILEDATKEQQEKDISPVRFHSDHLVMKKKERQQNLRESQEIQLKKLQNFPVSENNLFRNNLVVQLEKQQIENQNQQNLDSKNNQGHQNNIELRKAIYQEYQEHQRQRQKSISKMRKHNNQSSPFSIKPRSVSTTDKKIKLEKRISQVNFEVKKKPNKAKTNIFRKYGNNEGSIPQLDEQEQQEHSPIHQEKQDLMMGNDVVCIKKKQIINEENMIRKSKASILKNPSVNISYINQNDITQEKTTSVKDNEELIPVQNINQSVINFNPSRSYFSMEQISAQQISQTNLVNRQRNTSIEQNQMIKQSSHQKQQQCKNEQNLENQIYSNQINITNRDSIQQLEQHEQNIRVQVNSTGSKKIKDQTNNAIKPSFNIYKKDYSAKYNQQNLSPIQHIEGEIKKSHKKNSPYAKKKQLNLRSICNSPNSDAEENNDGSNHPKFQRREERKQTLDLKTDGEDFGYIQRKSNPNNLVSRHRENSQQLNSSYFNNVSSINNSPFVQASAFSEQINF